MVVCQNCLLFRGASAILGISRRGVKDKTHVGDSFFHKVFDPALPGWWDERPNGRQPGGASRRQRRDRLEIEPADIIFIEGNFPFLIEEILPLIGIKVVYLADDHVRMKRKWKRDIDYRKKYDISYFRKRYFKDQFIMAQIAYLPQLEACDLCVDTTGAALWTTPEIARILKQG